MPTATTDLLVLDCATCRHTFHVRRSVASMVQVCPRCRHFVVPCEREVKPPGFTVVAPRTISPPILVTRPVPARIIVHPVGDPLAFLVRFVIGFIFGAGAVFGMILLLPLLLMQISTTCFLRAAVAASFRWSSNPDSKAFNVVVAISSISGQVMCGRRNRPPVMPATVAWRKPTVNQISAPRI
ncbi:MAG TPA: hypothetical protein VND64_08865 [Pirellulales bacterium]|nr:hypothetical protein [Pirellulales bacterium]